MMSPRSSVITATWVALNLIPLLLVAQVWLVLGYRRIGLIALLLYPVYVVPYGFFITLPVMVRLFRHPASLHGR